MKHYDHSYYILCPFSYSTRIFGHPISVPCFIPLDLSNCPPVFWVSLPFPFPFPACRERKTKTDDQPVWAREIRPVFCGGTLAKLVVPLLSKLMPMDGTRLIDPASRILLRSASIAEPWTPLCGYHPPPLLPFRLPVITRSIAAIINRANVRLLYGVHGRFLTAQK